MNKKDEEDGWRGFLRHCLKVKSEKELEALLDVYLTLSEKQEIAGRYLIIKALLKGEKPQREIAQEFQISIAKVSRGSNVLKITKPGLKKFLGA